MAAPAQRILVVDDDAVTRHILVGYLARAGFQTHTAQSGAEAIEVARSTQPSLVLLDLVIPAPDGFEVLQLLREDPMTRDLPVVVLTALDGDEEVERAFAMGADDFLRKPFRAAELLARIRGQLRLRGYLVELARKERDAQLMVELTQTLASSLDFREILFTVVRRIADAVNVDRCSIIVAREEGDLGFVVAASDDAGVPNLPIELEKYPEIQRVLQTREPLTIEDAGLHPLLDAVHDAAPSGVTSFTLLPIAYENRAMGVLFLRGAPGRGGLAERELWFCQVATNATAVALRNARVLEQLREETKAISTARHEAERRISLLERYADMFISSADGMVVTDIKGRTLFANPRASEILGYEEAEMRRMNAMSVVVEEDRWRAREIGRGVVRGEFPTNIDIRVRRKDGAERTVSVSFSELLRADDAMLLTLRDVTAERALALELARTTDFLDSLIDSSPDAIIAADPKGSMLVWNRAAERICGIPRAEVIGKRNVESIYPPGVAREIMRKIRGGGYGGPGRLEGYRTVVLAADGNEIPVLLSAGLVYENGTEAGTVGIFADQRDRLRIEENLARAQQKLALSEKHVLVAELAGAAAHELNQPLTSIMGYAELLLRRAGHEATLTQPASVILREAERIAEIVRKIGQITRYETKNYVGGTSILDLDRAAAPTKAPSSEEPNEGAARADREGEEPVEPANASKARSP